MGIRGFAGTLGVVIVVLVAANILPRFGPARTGLILGPAVAVTLLAFARRRGLSWDDLGMARGSWLKGAAYAAAAVVAVAAVYTVALTVPLTRLAFLDARYRMSPGPALLTALIVIPVGTVVLEEVAFRGVLLALIRRRHGMIWASGLSSILFGFWHVLPSLRLGRVNPAVAATVVGGSAQVLVVAGVVGFTAVAGLLLCELRRRSGSLLASAGLHWAVNALGVLVAAVLWATAAN